MNDLQGVISRLAQEPGTRLREIADGAGIPYGTLRKVHSGETPNPRYQTVDKLRLYYEANGGDAPGGYSSPAVSSSERA